jgi:hypothetical protein
MNLSWEDSLLFAAAEIVAFLGICVIAYFASRRKTHPGSHRADWR